MNKYSITFQDQKGKALNPQNKINKSNFPFTLNVTIGCLFQCLYCYTQGFPFSVHTEFGKEVKIKKWLPAQLDEELQKYRDLPQHLKRVQVNESSEGYLPLVMIRSEKELGKDIIRQALEVFRDHWNGGNRWMVHLLTKSHMVLKHRDILTEMRDQVQVEMTVTTLDERKKKVLEGRAPSVRKRLSVIRSLADAGIFVRLMAMPFIGEHDEAAELRQVAFDNGARAFKHKALNYWDEATLLQGRLERVKGRNDTAYEDLQVKSGEPVLENGQPETMVVLMPEIIRSQPKGKNLKQGKKGKGKRWGVLKDKIMTVENCGYSDINNVDWGYLR